MSDYVRNRAIGERIRLTRKRRGITITELAAEIELKPSTISHFEQGATAVPEERLEQIAIALAVPVATFTADLPMTGLSDDEAAMVRTLRGLPDTGRAYIGRLMADLASGEVAR